MTAAIYASVTFREINQCEVVHWIIGVYVRNCDPLHMIQMNQAVFD